MSSTTSSVPVPAWQGQHLNCPLCGCPSVVKGMNALPPKDPLLKFLLDNSTVVHANCDVKCKAQHITKSFTSCFPQRRSPCCALSVSETWKATPTTMTLRLQARM